MLNLDNKQYDLNTLFSFEVLKEILLKLARGQITLEEKVQNIINVYQNKENSEKEKYVNISETDDNNLNISKDLLNDEDEKSKVSGIIETKEIDQSKNPKQTKEEETATSFGGALNASLSINIRTYPYPSICLRCLTPWILCF